MKDARPFADLRTTGLLWLINKTTFHPRGFALAVEIDEGGATGWSLQGNGSEVWGFSEEVDDAKFAAAEAFLAEQRTTTPDHEDGPTMALVPEPKKVPRSNGWRQRKREREERERLAAERPVLEPVETDEERQAAYERIYAEGVERQARQDRARKRAAESIYE